MKKKTHQVRTAIIGGSGVYQIKNLKVVDHFFPSTPFGKPSDRLVIGDYEGHRCVFLPRHGVGHRFLPSEIPQRANFYALKMLGVEHVVALSACGSLKETLAPRHFVIPDQLIDRTKGRVSTFFGDGLVAHVSLAHPFSPTLSAVLVDAAKRLGLAVQAGGTYVCMEGPAFSTQAESRLHRQWGADVIGMTAVPEAKLAREAEMSYALVAMVTDYDCWREGEEVSVPMVVENLLANSENARRLLAEALPRLTTVPNDCEEALRDAIFTSPEHIKPAVKKKLGPLIAKYVK